MPQARGVDVAAHAHERPGASGAAGIGAGAGDAVDAEYRKRDRGSVERARVAGVAGSVAAKRTAAKAAAGAGAAAGGDVADGTSATRSECAVAANVAAR